MAKRGRPQKPYQASWGVPIAGLARDSDGRWRVFATGRRFTEHDERRAVAKFYRMTKANRVQRMMAPIEHQVVHKADKTVRRAPSLVAMDRFVQSLRQENPITVLLDKIGDSAYASQDVDATILADWLREQLRERPGWVAELVGIPELISLQNFQIPKAPVTVRQVIDAYREHSSATPKSKREAIRQFERLANFTHARTLDEATNEDALLRFRAEVLNDRS